MNRSVLPILSLALVVACAGLIDADFDSARAKAGAGGAPAGAGRANGGEGISGSKQTAAGGLGNAGTTNPEELLGGSAAGGAFGGVGGQDASPPTQGGAAGEVSVGASGPLAYGGISNSGGSSAGGRNASSGGSGGTNGSGGSGGTIGSGGSGGTNGSGGSGGTNGSGGSGGTNGSGGSGGTISSGAGGMLGKGGSSGGSGGTLGKGGASGSSGGAASCPPQRAGIPLKHPIYGCGERFKPLSGSGDWVVFDSGLRVDEKTGYGWIDGNGSHSQAGAIAACEKASVAGLTDWVLPNIDQSRTLAGGCAPTAPGGTCRISDPGCLQRACGRDSLCRSCTGGQGMKYCRDNVDAQICLGLGITTSMCSDCVGSQTMWAYLAGNGNFTLLEVAPLYGHLCVQTTIPNY